MRIHIGTDHAGFELKTRLVEHWRSRGHEVVDHGAFEYDPADDYPAFCFACGEGVAADPGSLGVVLGGSGNGEQIAANKVPGVRAVLVWSVETARLARAHNDANVAGFGVRQHSAGEAVETTTSAMPHWELTTVKPPSVRISTIGVDSPEA